MPRIHRLSELTDDHVVVDRIIRDHWPAGQSTQWEVIGGGLDNEILATTGPESPPLIMKMRRPGVADRSALTIALSKELRAAGLPVPEYIWHNTKIYLETRMPGIDLNSPRRRSDPSPVRAGALVQAGRLLRRLHALPRNGFGRMDSLGRGRHETAAAWLLALPPSSGLGALLDEAAALASRCLHMVAAEMGRRPSMLLHGDWGSRHVMSVGSGVTGIVDLDSARAGDPLMDLAGWSINESAADNHIMMAGYFGGSPPAECETLLGAYRLRIAASMMTFMASRGQLAEANVHRRAVTAEVAHLCADGSVIW